MPDQGSPVIQASLTPLPLTATVFYFPLNPSKVTRARLPRYAQIPIAAANADNYQNPPLFEWIGNAPEEIHIEFLLASLGADDVEDSLSLLDQFMQKRDQTQEPPDIIFAMGRRIDLVRIFQKDVEEQIYSSDLRVQRASVRLTMRTIKLRSGG